MTIERRLEIITDLANERAELQVRLGQIDDELREIFGMDKAEKKPEPEKVRGGGASKAKANGSRPCGCGPRGRHKAECNLKDGSLPPDTVPSKWECLECASVTKSEDKPDECDCGGKTFIQK